MGEVALGKSLLVVLRGLRGLRGQSEPLLFPLLQGARSCFPSAKRGRALPQPFDKLRGACSTAYP